MGGFPSDLGARDRTDPTLPPPGRGAIEKVAIQTAIASAAQCDVVVIAGKGHEKSQILLDRVIPFDDVEVATQAIQECALSNNS